MLIYATYTPNEPTSWNREHVFAFASIERFVEGLRLVNEMGERKGTLRPVTAEEALKISSLATLFTASDKSDAFKKGPLINIGTNGARDDWDGSWREVELVECIEDESL